MSPSAALSHICPVQLQGETLGLAPVSDSSPVRPREPWRELELCSLAHSWWDSLIRMAERVVFWAWLLPCMVLGAVEAFVGPGILSGLALAIAWWCV